MIFTFASAGRVRTMYICSGCQLTIASAQLNGVDAFTNAVEELQSVTEADVADFMKRLMAQGNYRVVILDPEAAE